MVVLWLRVLSSFMGVVINGMEEFWFLNEFVASHEHFAIHTKDGIW